MRFHSAARMAVALNMALVAFLTGSGAALGAPAGTVAIVEGNAYVQRGEIYYTRPTVGQEVKVNEFGQYRDDKPAPAYVKWEQNTRRHLKPNDTIEEGEIIQTMGDGWLKILFNDDSLMDIGPAAMVQLQKFQGQGKDRHVVFKVLYGKVRGVVAQALSTPANYEILTPTALMGVRGTEFLVNVYPDKEHRTQTEVVCLHGQVSVDVTKYNAKGLVYTQPMVVNPGSVFATGGVHGFGQETTLRPLSQDSLRTIVARLSPSVNTRATIVGANPPPARLPGTGLRMTYVADNKPKRVKDEQPINSFDLDHPPAERMVASASGNFDVPHDFGDAPGAFGRYKDIRNFTGAPPTQFLPATNSHVRINLIGVH